MQTSKDRETDRIPTPAREEGRPARGPGRSAKTILIESAAATAILVIALAVFRVPYLGVGTLAPHPIWIVVLVVAARYGGQGLLIAAALGWVTLAGALGVAGEMPGMVLAVMATPSELAALSAAVLVGWVASVHERRALAVTGKLEELERRAAVDATSLAELRRAALALRARNDRLDLSLTFLRDVARRLESGDREAAMQAALDLAFARLGPRGAAIAMVGSEAREAGPVTLAQGGLWHPDGEAAGSGRADRTIAEVMRTGRPARAVELAESGPTDSDLAAPIVDDGGVLRGVLAVRGMIRGGAGVAALRDLTVIAEWCGRALGKGGAPRALPEPAGPLAPAPIGPRNSFASVDAPPRSISQINV